MGARLVSLVLARWTHVSDRAFRVLVKMAHTSLDDASEKTPAATYFGGRDALADVLRNEGGSTQTRYRVVKRLLAELIDEKAIERTQAGRVGQNAVYTLTLAGSRKIDEPLMGSAPKRPAQGGRKSPPQGGPQSPPEGGSDATSRGAQEAPSRNHDEPGEEPGEEVRRELLPIVPAVGTTGGHAAPQTPLRPGGPSGHRISPASETFVEEQQPPQDPTATYDRAREADPPPALRLVPGNPDATPTEDRASLFPAAVPGPPRSPLRRPDRAAQAIAEATARRQAAIAAHRAAREAAGE